MRNILLFGVGSIVTLMLLMAGCRNEQTGAIPDTGPAFVSVPGWSDISHQSMAGALPYTVGGRLPGRKPTIDPSKLPACLQVDAIAVRKQILPSRDVEVRPAVVKVALPEEPMSEPAEMLLAVMDKTGETKNTAAHAVGPGMVARAMPLDDGPELEPADPITHTGNVHVGNVTDQPIAEVLISLTPETQPETTIPAPEIGMADRDFRQGSPEPELFTLN